MVRCSLIHSLTLPLHNNNIPLQIVSVSPTFHHHVFITTNSFSFALMIGWVDGQTKTVSLVHMHIGNKDYLQM
jgi:hypothetical protein